MIGKESVTFNLLLEKDFERGDILNSGVLVEVISPPKKRDTWYWAVLRFLTFGKFFQPCVYHKVKII